MAEEHETAEKKKDTLNELGVLKRREIEARIVGPIVEALGKEFGQERVVEVVRDTIVKIAHEQGDELAMLMGGRSLDLLSQSLDLWKKDDALHLDVLEQTEERLAFNVTRCRYAELYRALGMAELGATLSCNRDFAMSAGFNPDIALTRTQTIMQGASHCDFRYSLQSKRSKKRDE